MSGRMQAVLLTGHGGLDKLEFREDAPIPAPNAEEVLIKVGATGINNTDIWTREGAYGQENKADAISGWLRDQAFSFPRIQGADIAGHIVALGEEVAAIRLGERVLVNPTLYGDHEEEVYDGFIGSERDGGFAGYVCVPAANAHVISATLTDAELATFPTAYLTALHMLNRARLTAGETILITGASGGVGSALVQLAHLRGARIIAIAGRGKEQGVAELGAEIVVSRQGNDLPQRIREAAAERSVDVVADIVGGSMVPMLLQALCQKGRYVTAGAIAGPLVQLDLRTIYLNQLQLIGSTLGTRQEFSELVQAIETGRLKALLAGTYPLRDIVKAQKDFMEKRFLGKLVLVPDSDF